MFLKTIKSFGSIELRHLSSKTPLKAGDKVVYEKTIDAFHVKLFEEITGDGNPIHFRKENPVVHGALLNGLVSTVLGTKLPGPGSIITSQVLKFTNPCFVGEKVSTAVEIVSVRKIIECTFVCSVDQKVVLEGSAKVILNNSVLKV